MENKNRAFISTIFLLLFFALPVLSQELLYPTNLDFEEGQPGDLPSGWTIPGFAIKNKYDAFLTTDSPKKGKKCLELNHIAPLDSMVSGAVMQTIDAKPYRGKRIRFRAALCAEILGKTGSAHLWLRTILTDKCEGFSEYKDLEPVVNTDWNYYEITGKIDENAATILFGLLLNGRGRAWIDDASFEVLDQKIPEMSPPKVLEGQALTNLIALAKVYGYVRYFYPGSELQFIKWDNFLYNSVKDYEPLASTTELAVKLENDFSRIAPGIAINQKQKISDCGFKTAPPNSAKNIVLVRKQNGPDILTTGKNQNSEIVNIYNPQREREGIVFQVIDASSFRGKKIRFSSDIKADLVPPYSQAQLGLRVNLSDKKPGFNGIMWDNPAKINKWTNYSIETVVPEKAETINIGLVLIGDGDVWFDNTKLTICGSNGKEQTFDLRNAGFEESDTGRIVKSWTFPNPSINAGYFANVTIGAHSEGKKSLHLFSEEVSRVIFPEVGESYKTELNKDLSFCMPLTS
ncbi:MAG: hypothetical protein WCT77_13365, partial [Bacteroidota bacterium]